MSVERNHAPFVTIIACARDWRDVAIDHVVQCDVARAPDDVARADEADSGLAGPIDPLQRFPHLLLSASKVDCSIAAAMNPSSVAPASGGNEGAGESSSPSSSSRPAMPTLQTMDDIVQLSVQASSSADPRHETIDVLLPALEDLWNTKGGFQVFLQGSADRKDPLSLLDPRTHTVAHLYILWA